MDLHALGEQVGSGFVVGFFNAGEHGAGSAYYGLLAFHQQPDHILGGRHPIGFFDGGQAGVLLVSTGCRKAQCADAFGNFIYRQSQLALLSFEHLVQGVEHGARHVPVEVVGLQIKCGAVGQ